MKRCAVILFFQAKQRQKQSARWLPLTRTEMSLSDASLLTLNDSSVDMVPSPPRLRVNADDERFSLNHTSRRLDGLDTSLYIRSDSSQKVSKGDFSSLTREGSPRKMHVRFMM